MKRQALNWLAERLGPLILRAWFATIRLRWYGGTHLDPDPRGRGSAIYVLWHQRLLCFAYTHGRFGGRLLISRSKDGETLARLAAALGFFPIRGSSRRGGVAAIRALLAESGSGHDFGLTPDGPRGPAQVFKVGAVYLASRSGLPIVPITVAYRRCWHVGSWDRLQLPWPFTRGVIHVGTPVMVPPALDDVGLEAWRAQLEETLRSHTRITDQRVEEFYRGGLLRHDLPCEAARDIEDRAAPLRVSPPAGRSSPLG